MVLMKTVEDFLEKGKLVSPDLYEELENLNDEDIESLIDSQSLVLSREDMEALKIPEPKIIERDENGKGSAHVSDFTQFYLKRFNFLKGKIEEKLEDGEISSVDKLSSGSAVVIGMVREVGDSGTVLEDNTGQLTLQTDERFLEDEVIGVKGEVIMNDEPKMSPKKIVYPDVPLGKEVKTTEEEFTALFASSITQDLEEKIEELKPNYLFLSEEVEDFPEAPTEAYVVGISENKGKDGNTKLDRDPVWVKIDGLTLFLHSGKAVNQSKRKLGTTQNETLLTLLKKRHFYPSNIHSLNDRYLLEEIPDIVHVHGEEGSMANYKGVTLLSTTEDQAYLLNLKTREAEEVEL